MLKIPLFCVCSRPWKKCINKRWSKKVVKEKTDIFPYTLGMAELGYEYDFLNNTRVRVPCLKNGYMP